MADLISDDDPVPATDPELRQGIELLFFAYRDFTGDADRILADYGFGRAHHRVIYFVGRQPGLNVSDLLAVLKITKQSLSRVLGQLIELGFVDQIIDREDGRRRLLKLTAKGRTLEAKLSAVQARRIAAAFDAAGDDAVAGFRKVMLGIVNHEDRQRAMAPYSDDAAVD